MCTRERGFVCFIFFIFYILKREWIRDARVKGMTRTFFVRKNLRGYFPFSHTHTLLSL